MITITITISMFIHIIVNCIITRIRVPLSIGKQLYTHLIRQTMENYNKLHRYSLTNHEPKKGEHVTAVLWMVFNSS